MEKVKISVVVITKNEENNIEECLQSVLGWVDEIVVVDDNSTDCTVEIAEKYAQKVFHRKMDNEGTHRNWAYAQAKNDWVLSLDADERVSPELRDELFSVLDDPKVHCFTIPRRNYIGDYWVKYGGQYPAAQLRLFLKARFKYEEVEVHPRVFFQGETGYLKGDIIHKSYKNFAHFLTKMNGQTTLEAKKWFKSNKKMTFGKALWRTIDRFFRSYIGKRGYKDGFVGFMLAVFSSFYQIVSYAKYWEFKKQSEDVK